MVNRNPEVDMQSLFVSQRQHPDERWVANIRGTTIPSHLSHLETARLGEQAYNLRGKELDPEVFRPLFVRLKEKDEYRRADVIGHRT